MSLQLCKEEFIVSVDFPQYNFNFSLFQLTHWAYNSDDLFITKQSICHQLLCRITRVLYYSHFSSFSTSLSTGTVAPYCAVPHFSPVLLCQSSPLPDTLSSDCKQHLFFWPSTAFTILQPSRPLLWACKFFFPGWNCIGNGGVFWVHVLQIAYFQTVTSICLLYSDKKDS